MSKNRFSKGIVALIVALNVLFTAAVLVIFWHTSSEPAALIVAWFGFTTAELWQLATIKKSKIKTDPTDRTTI